MSTSSTGSHAKVIRGHSELSQGSALCVKRRKEKKGIVYPWHKLEPEATHIHIHIAKLQGDSDTTSFPQRGQPGYTQSLQEYNNNNNNLMRDIIHNYMKWTTPGIPWAYITARQHADRHPMTLYISLMTHRVVPMTHIHCRTTYRASLSIQVLPEIQDNHINVYLSRKGRSLHFARSRRSL